MQHYSIMMTHHDPVSDDLAKSDLYTYTLSMLPKGGFKNRKMLFLSNTLCCPLDCKKIITVFFFFFLFNSLDLYVCKSIKCHFLWGKCAWKEQKPHYELLDFVFVHFILICFVVNFVQQLYHLFSRLFLSVVLFSFA